LFNIRNLQLFSWAFLAGRRQRAAADAKAGKGRRLLRRGKGLLKELDGAGE
jgi:hypothetical protein